MDWAKKFWMLSLIFQFVTALTDSRCSFPSEWQGLWFENGLGEIRLSSHVMSHKGHCFSSDHRKYLLINKDRGCFLCLVFTPQHSNLLQYKESFCVSNDSLATACGTITPTPDYPLHTMVKVPGQPIPCPFQGPYFFTYTNGSVAEWCKEPFSEIHACADKSRFIFSYRHCKGLAYTQDVEKIFQCLAVWQNGMDRLLYGSFIHDDHQEQKRMYRCFLYKRDGADWLMTMSPDATCQGLTSPELGMNSFSLQFREDRWPKPDCQFPEWLNRNSTWRDTAGQWRLRVTVDGEELMLHDLLDPDFLTPGEITVLRLRCFKFRERTPYPEEHLLTFAVSNICASTYRCVRLKQRADHVFEMRIGAASDDTYLACEDSYFSRSDTHMFFPYEEILVHCPRYGRYRYHDVEGDCGGTLEIGCHHPSQMLLHPTCGQQQTEILQCYQTWLEGSQVYTIAGRPGKTYNPAHCLVFKDAGNGFILEEASDCGGEAIHVMNRPLNYVVSSPKEVCERTPSPPYHPLQPGPKNSTMVLRKDVTSTLHSSGVMDGDGLESSTGVTRVNVINCSNTQTLTLHVSVLCITVTFLLQKR